LLPPPSLGYPFNNLPGVKIDLDQELIQPSGVPKVLGGYGWMGHGVVDPTPPQESPRTLQWEGFKTLYDAGVFWVPPNDATFEGSGFLTILRQREKHREIFWVAKRSRTEEDSKSCPLGTTNRSHTNVLLKMMFGYVIAPLGGFPLFDFVSCCLEGCVNPFFLGGGDRKKNTTDSRRFSEKVNQKSFDA